MRTGMATFTLDTGRCPRWLFDRMVRCARQMLTILVEQFGPVELIRRLSDPVWFQSLGTVLAFDWNASGLTTVLCGALKEAVRGREMDMGVFICGGKGRASRKTPDQILDWSSKLGLPSGLGDHLVYSSRMSAKVDNCLVQDGYQVYHHCFFFCRNGAWTVVQQGMNQPTGTARRYHWHSAGLEDLIVEPHTGIVTQARYRAVLDMTARASQVCRQQSLDLVNAGYRSLARDLQVLRRHAGPYSRMATIRTGGQQLTLLELDDVEFSWHPVLQEDLWHSKYLGKILALVCDTRPSSYEQLLALQGVGPKTIRALALVSEVIYGARPSYEDPARYSFAYGGKDGTPFEVDRQTYDQTIATLIQAVRRSRLAPADKDRALRSLTSGHLQG